ncbi:MAG: iron-sulfur cluster-binding protein [Deltaproteobacteria bacterium]|nr:iron-sulfur cluster-binding protein [Deltaproteobacteria bacterium]
MKIKTEQFKKEARRALASGNMQLAISRASKRFSGLRSQAFQNLPGGEELRTRAHQIKTEAVAHLDEYVEQFAAAAAKLGIRVYRSPDGADACRYIEDLARAQGIQTVVKGKSMTTEEIDLNQTLQQAGIQVWETDLGEFIIQLAGEPPSHIIAPALHKTQQEIADLFTEKLGVPRYEDPEKLTMVAREFLREKYFQAGMGISGANFALAGTGTIVILENEGNARFSTTFPRIHVAVVGIEKVIPGLAELGVFLKLLARSATGQKMSTYVSLIQGPGRNNEADGPEEMHIILLDNGRSKFRQDPELRPSLYCLRCGACLNVCPVYQRIGGHAYGWVYSGPIGSVLTPQFLGTLRAKDLPLASTLCGACAEVCPVRIPLPDLLLTLRRRIVEQQGHSGWERSLMKGWAACQTSPGCYRTAFELARLGQDFFPGLYPSGLELPDKNFHRIWKDEYQD